MAYGRSEGPGLLSGLMAALIVATGIAASGAFVADGIVRNRTADNKVTVKGLAEREVKADLAVWPITITSAGDDMALVQEKIDADYAKVVLFLVERGFDEAEISRGRLQLEDRVANSWSADLPRGGRYLINQPIKVRSTRVDLVAQVSRELGPLVREGVVMTGWQGPSYVFTQLNDVKPDMLEDATTNAREAAVKFAEDSGAQLGSIRDANQGVFVILPRDEAPGETESDQIFKTVRVVSTITYQLEE